MVRIECKAQLEPKSKIQFNENSLSLEYIGKSSTSTFNLNSLGKENGLMTFSLLQSVTSRFAIGSELLMEWHKNVYGLTTSMALRYANEKSAYAATISTQALDVSYWCVLNKNIQLGLSLLCNNRKPAAISAIYYQWQFKDAYVRGMFNSDLGVGFSYNR